MRRVKEYSGDIFKCLPISDIIRNLELNPYIPTTILREPYRCKVQDVIIEEVSPIIEVIESSNDIFISKKNDDIGSLSPF